MIPSNWRRTGGVDQVAVTTGESVYTPSTRAERLVAGGRVALAVFSLLAVWLDPTTPTRYASLSYGLLAAYAAYSLALAGLAWRYPATTTARRFITHAVDLAIFSAVIYLTEGATSPFFLFFVFSLIAATLRFRISGTLWTAVAALSIFVGMGLYASIILEDPEFELNRFLIRSVYLTIVAVLLIYLTAYQEQHRRELHQLAAWPRRIAGDFDRIIAEMLENAARVLGVRRAAIAWRPGSRGDVFLAWTEEGEYQRVPWPGATVTALFDPYDFHCRDLRAPVPSVVRARGSKFESVEGQPLDRHFLDRFDPRAILSIRMGGKRITGRLFALDPGEITADEIVLARVVTELISSRIEEHFLLDRLRNVAVTTERMRLSRQLHDGVLQSLTGIALQLRVAERVLLSDPERTTRILNDVRELIVENQGELRRFVESLREREPESFRAATLDDELAAVVERASAEWDLDVEIDIADHEPIPEPLIAEISLLVHEALSNAKKHGDAASIVLAVTFPDSSVRLSVRDDGCGFPFHGRRTLAELDADGFAPRSLKERTLALHGNLSIETFERGALVEIQVPISLADAQPDPWAPVEGEKLR